MKNSKIVVIILFAFVSTSLSFSQIRKQVGLATSGMSNTMIAAGWGYTLTIKNGEVWGWGDNSGGQLGNGQSGSNVPINKSSPVKASGLSGIIAVVASRRGYVGQASFALKSDGTVWSWGGNDNGQLGIGNNVSSKTPVQVKGVGGSGFLQNIIAISEEMALSANGTVFAWGGNYIGQVGDGTNINRTTPVQVKGPGGVGVLSDIIAIVKKDFSSMALKSDGTIWTWGFNDYGILGDGTNTSKNTPVQVKGPGGIGFLNNIVGMDMGLHHCLAVKSDGTVWSWGSTLEGELGDNVVGYNNNGYVGPYYKATPVQVTGLNGNGFLTNVVDVVAGTYFSAALKSDGTVWNWGSNSEMGSGNIAGDKCTPLQVLGINGSGVINNVVSIFTSENNTILLQANGTISGWQYPGNFPVQLSQISAGTLAVAAGSSHSLDLRTSGKVFSWGSNSYGQLGNGGSGANAFKKSPVSVKGVGGSGNLENIIAVSGGLNHSIALTSDGKILAWGNNLHGELGNGNFNSSVFPGFVKLSYGGSLFSITTMIAISTNGGSFNYGQHNLALADNGTVWAWGANDKGQCGTGSIGGYQNVIKQVVGLTNIIAVACGPDHSLALKSDGTVWAWGNNFRGQLGNGMSGYGNNKSTPVQVAGLTNVVAIAAGGTRVVGNKDEDPIEILQIGGGNSMALKADGTVWTWGSNEVGQLGNGTYASAAVVSTSPVQVIVGYFIGVGNVPAPLTNVKAIYAGGYDNPPCYALTAKGKISYWGANISEGILGTATQQSGIIAKTDLGINEVKSISVTDHSLAGKANWGVCSMGLNSFGQLGIGNTTNSSTYNCGISFPAGMKTEDEEFTIVDSNISDKKYSFTIFPNPTSGNFTVQVESSNNSHAKVQLTNLLGETVFTSEIEISEGNNSLQISPENLPDGMYLFTFSSPENNFISKVFINH